jgi:uncharacterized protein YciI
MRKYFLITLISFILFGTCYNSIAQSNKDLFFVFLNPNPDKTKISDAEADKLQTAHLKNIEKLNQEGKLFAAGPFEGGGGMFILHAENIELAKSYLNSDPAIAANRFNIEIFPFVIWNGKMCGAKKPYEMTNYKLVRLITNYDDPGDLEDAISKNRVFMGDIHTNTNKLVVMGKFGEDNDGVLILNVPDVESAKDLLNTNPAIKNNSITYDIKTLWIAKGAFCEKE